METETMTVAPGEVGTVDPMLIEMTPNAGVELTIGQLAQEYRELADSAHLLADRLLMYGPTLQLIDEAETLETRCELKRRRLRLLHQRAERQRMAAERRSAAARRSVNEPPPGQPGGSGGTKPAEAPGGGAPAVAGDPT